MWAPEGILSGKVFAGNRLFTGKGRTSEEHKAGFQCWSQRAHCNTWLPQQPPSLMQWGEVCGGKLALRPARRRGAEENLRPAGGGARHGGGTLGTGGRQTAKSLAALGHSSGRGCYYCFSSSLAQPWDIYVAPWLGSLPLLFYFFFFKEMAVKGKWRIPRVSFSRLLKQMKKFSGISLLLYLLTALESILCGTEYKHHHLVPKQNKKITLLKATEQPVGEGSKWSPPRQWLRLLSST